MNKHLAFLFGMISCLVISCSSTNSVSNENETYYKELSPFAVSYEKLNKEQVKKYDLVIVEPNHYNKSEIRQLKSTGATVLAYVSLGEVNKNRWYFSKLKERRFLGKNENWDSYYIDLGDSVSYHFLLEQVIPEIMIREFDGLFMDTIDAVAPYTQRSYLQPRMESLINTIHQKYPQKKLIQNAGLFLLDKTADAVDGVLVEDVATHYDFSENLYSMQKAETFLQKVKSMEELSDKYKLPFLVVDFADTKGLKDTAQRRLDSLAFPYYISSIGLNDIKTGISGNSY